MDEGKMLRINCFLTENGASVDTIPKSILNYLEKVDDSIQKRLFTINKAKETLKNSAINITVISNDTEISRKTFYNNDLLKMYVELHTIDNSEKNINLEEYEKIRVKNDELKKQISNFLLRDIDTENLRHENLELNREISDLNIRNKSLEYQSEELQKELSNLKRKLIENDRTIIQFPGSVK